MPSRNLPRGVAFAPALIAASLTALLALTSCQTEKSAGADDLL